MMKKLILIFTLLTTGLYSQKNINNYKYILVSKRFDFLNKPDQYQTSSLTKFLFNKYGFTAFIDDEKLPEDLIKNRCLALFADVKNHSGMFSTKTSIELKDCHNKIVFTSKEGKSKNKDYKGAYQEAIRSAFQSIKNLNYHYKPTKITTVHREKITVKNMPQVSGKKEVTQLYAQSIPNGFQLVDTKPAVIFQILQTNLKDIFIIKNKGGILYKNGKIWVAEYYQNGRLVQSQYLIKF